VLFPKDLGITKSFGICTYKSGGVGGGYLSSALPIITAGLILKCLFASTSVPFRTGRLLHLIEHPFLHHSSDTQFTCLRRGPRAVGRYEILEIIGTGATGRVARAHDSMIASGGHQAFLQRTLGRAKAVCVFSRKARVVGAALAPSIRRCRYGHRGIHPNALSVLWDS